MHPDCCFAYVFFCFISAWFPHSTVEHLQNCFYRASWGSKSTGFALRGSTSIGFMRWETQSSRTPALGLSNHQECFLKGPNSTGVLRWRSQGCQAAGVGLLTFSHTVRIVSAYVSHTQTPFCAHLTILCSRTALYRSRSFIRYVIRPRKANDACAGATIQL